VPLGLCEHPDRGAAPIEASQDFGPPTPNVLVALHLDEPLAADRTVVWTAAFQAAWDRLGDALGSPGTISLAAPAHPDAVEALNAGRLAADALDPRDLTVIAGPATEATWNAIGQVSEHPRPPAAPDPSDQDVVAFARVAASVRYEIPFFVKETPLHFGPRRIPVRAWGLRKSAFGETAERMREQVRIHVPRESRAEDAARTGVIVITAKDGKRVVVSGRQARETLRETWRDAAVVIRTAPGQSPSSVTQVSIPRISIVAGRNYEEIAPAKVEGRDFLLALARQDVRLLVDERGADVEAEGVIVAVGALPTEIDIDGPFLVALLGPGSDQPFVLAWVGSADGLTPWDALVGRPLSGVEVRAFVSTWGMDPEASTDATVAEMQRVLGPDGVRWAGVKKEDAAGWFTHRTFSLQVGDDGDARVSIAAEGSIAARLARDGGRTILTTPGSNGRGDDAWELSRVGDRLRLHLRSRSEVLVLRRR